MLKIKMKWIKRRHVSKEEVGRATKLSNADNN